MKSQPVKYSTRVNNLLLAFDTEISLFGTKQQTSF